MTPINPAAAGGLPQYAGQGYAQTYDELPVDPYEGMDPNAYVQPDPYAAGYSDPYLQGQYADPYAQQYVDPYAGQVASGPQVYAEPYTGGGQVYADPYSGGGQVVTAPYYPQQPVAQPTVPVAGTQPATTGPAGLGAGYAPGTMPATGPAPGGGGIASTTGVPGATGGGGAQPASVEDFAQLGIFDEQALQALAASGMSPQELGQLYDEVLVELQDPEVQKQLAAQQAAGGADQAGGAGQAGGAAEKPAWNDEWKAKFQKAFDAQGLDSKTQMLVLGQLGSLGIGETELKQAFEYYSNTPEGKAELQQVNQQVKDAKGKENLQYAALGGLTLAGGVGTTLLAKSKGNLVKALTRTALNPNATKAQVAAATQMLGQLEKNGAPAATRALSQLKVKGIPITAIGRASEEAIQARAVTALRETAGSTNRLLHPGKKMVLNAGARHLTPATRMSGKDMMKYALWMKSGDNVADAAKAGGAVSKVVKGGGAVADDAIRAAGAAGKAGTAAKAAGGAAAAAKGAGALSKIGRAAGPIGLIASTGLGIWGISETVKAEGGFGKESKKMTGNVAGGLAGGMAGAAAGAAIGSVVPVIGTGVGAIVGGLVGGFGGGAIGEALGGLF